MSIDWNWVVGWIARQIGTILVLLGLARVVFQPWLDAYFLAALGRKRAEVKMWLVQEVHRERFAEYDAAAERARATAQSMEALFASVQLQGAELGKLRDRIQDMPRMADALDRIDVAVEAIARSSADTRDLVMKLQGAWEKMDRHRP